MLNYLKQSKLKFDALQPRERILAVLAVAVLMYFFVNMVLLTPERAKQKTLEQQIVVQQKELAALNSVIGEIAARIPQDASSSERTKRDSLKKMVAEADAQLGLSNGESHQVGALLKTLLAANPRLKLVTPVVSGSALSDAKPAVSTNSSRPPITLYKHGIEVSIKGDYFALLSCLESLQKYPRRLFWSDIRLDVVTYPESVLKMTIYTLSEQSSSPLG